MENEKKHWSLLLLPPCLVLSCTPHCPPPPPSLPSNEADEAQSKMTSYFLETEQENDASDNLIYGCKWASDAQLMCGGQEGAELSRRCITLVPSPLLPSWSRLTCTFCLPLVICHRSDWKKERNFLDISYQIIAHLLPVKKLNIH